MGELRFWLAAKGAIKSGSSAEAGPKAEVFFAGPGQYLPATFCFQLLDLTGAHLTERLSQMFFRKRIRLPQPGRMGYISC